MVNKEYDVLNEIQTEVLGYLDEHPNAADSMEAIRQWWILQRVSKYSREMIQQALDKLVEARLVERRLLRDGRELYAKAQQRQKMN
jgi:hypothetical protein